MLGQPCVTSWACGMAQRIRKTRSEGMLTWLMWSVAAAQALQSAVMRLASVRLLVFEAQKLLVYCLQELHSALKKVQSELSKYSRVNKKALDQFTNFTEQKEELTRRVNEVRQSGEMMSGRRV